MKLAVFISMALFALVSSLFSLDFIAPEDLKPGMKGYGLTVFKGWEPERFDVEIVDVMRASSPKGDMILARLSGSLIDKSGVAAGMSGSPVYIEGKLAGAVAYTWPFLREPLCGITPIHQMIREKDNAGKPLTDKTPTTDKRLKKIATPVFQSGFSGEALSFIEKSMSTSQISVDSASENFIFLDGSKNAETMIAVPSKTQGIPDSEFHPGDAVSINMVDGDFTMQGVGTVTYVSNNDVYIFGHPMDSAGLTALPISKSYIYTIIPSGNLSFKLGSSSKPLGATVYDGQNAVYCKTDAPYKMVPLDITVKNDGATNRYQLRIIDNRNYFPSLASGVVSSSFLNHSGTLDNKRLGLNLTMNMDYEGKSITITNRFYYAFNPSYYNILSLLNDLSQYFSAFYENFYGKTSITSVSVSIDIEKGLKYYLLDGVNLEKQIFAPGDTIQCKVDLKQFQGAGKTIVLPVKIPTGLKNGQYWLIVSSEMGLFGEIVRLFPRYFMVNGMEDILRFSSFKEDITLLSASVLAGKPGIILDDKKLEHFPPQYSSFFTRTSDRVMPSLFPDMIMASHQLDGAVYGTVKIPVNIMNKQTESME